MIRDGRNGTGLACVLALLLAAPARGAGLVPLAMSLDDARVALSHARMLVVEQLGEEQHSGTLPERPWDASFTVARRETASAEWADRFRHLILGAGPYSVFGRCPGIDSLDHSMPARFQVILVRHPEVRLTGSSETVWIRFRSGMPCAQFGSAKRPGGSLEISGVADSLFAMLRAAVGADDRVGSAADSVAGGRPQVYAPGGRNPQLGAHGDSVFVDVLPDAIDKVPPQYPIQARIDGVSGTVIVIALISVEGRVADAFVQDSIPELDLAAMTAVRQWKFKPASGDGKPMAVWVAVPVKFTLH